MILAATCWLNEHKDYVDSLNVFPVPDGDTGTNMYLTVLNAAREIQNSESERVCDIAEALQQGALMGARGNSGVILSQLFRGIAHGLKNKNVMSAADLANALKCAYEMAYKAVMKPVEGTILTVARFVGDGAVEKAKKSDDIIEVLDAAIEEGRKALKKTPEMLPVLKEAKVVDAGGQGYIFLLEGALRVLKGQPVEGELKVYEGQKVKEPVYDAKKTSDKEIKYQYCTEFIIMSENVPLDKVREHLENYGDSLLVVGSKGITKVHVHTNNPGLVLEYALKYGPLNKIKIENMVEQSQERDEKQSLSKKPFGIVAVVAGEGFKEIFESLGVDEVVRGGQSMNPSTQDLVEAVERVNSDHVIILPNNKNIIFAAEQVKNISKKEIIVVPTRSIPQGIGSLMKIDPELNFSEIAKAMIQGLEEVKTGEITYAVRDSKVNSFDIKERDCLGLYNGDIQVVDKDCEKVSLELLDKMIDEDDFLITIYYGSNVSEDQAEKLRKKIEERFKNQDIELYYGGQPLYDYIFSVE
ncbi:hypothetical protein BBF96_05380 [Anoxybacter fermentans]|uniref:DhaL domain-containing protein n=2 Tax=Anoxybacter fermentans TaxID=1323375 RepID=A0A3Q9HT61_9FIRM|nr:hypothetical protein BBF96_05380 [Anoxybacter fermentans]